MNVNDIQIEISRYQGKDESPWWQLNVGDEGGRDERLQIIWLSTKLWRIILSFTFYWKKKEVNVLIVYHGERAYHSQESERWFGYSIRNRSISEKREKTRLRCAYRDRSKVTVESSIYGRVLLAYRTKLLFHVYGSVNNWKQQCLGEYLHLLAESNVLGRSPYDITLLVQNGHSRMRKQGLGKGQERETENELVVLLSNARENENHFENTMPDLSLASRISHLFRKRMSSVFLRSWFETIDLQRRMESSYISEQLHQKTNRATGTESKRTNLFTVGSSASDWSKQERGARKIIASMF